MILNILHVLEKNSRLANYFWFVSNCQADLGDGAPVVWFGIDGTTTYGLVLCLSYCCPVSSQHWSEKCFACTSGSVLFNMPFSYTLFALTNIGCFFHTPRNAGMGPAVQVTGKVKSKRRPPRLQHLHLQISLSPVSMGGLCVYTLSTSGTTQVLVAVDLLTLVKKHEVLLIKKHYKCNKHESVCSINELRQNGPSKSTKTAFGAVLRWVCTDWGATMHQHIPATSPSRPHCTSLPEKIDLYSSLFHITQ